ncbi:MAG: CBS domain-containing protein [Motilibacteraceae bacterium]
MTTTPTPPAPTPPAPTPPSQRHDDPTPVSALLAGDVMSRSLVVVDAEDSVLIAWEVLTTAGVHHLPVLREGRLLGVISDRDLAVEWLVGPLARARRRTGEVVTRRPVRVRPEDSLGHVAAAMRATGTDCVAVTTPDGGLLGLITSRDVVAAVAGDRAQPPHRPIPPVTTTTTLFRMVPALPEGRSAGR